MKPGDNELQVKVVNLRIHRMIGDEALPDDSPRNPNGILKRWPHWLQDAKPSPTGPLYVHLLEALTQGLAAPTVRPAETRSEAVASPSDARYPS